MSWDLVRLGEVISHRKGFITIDDEKPYKLCRVQLHRRGVLLREIIKGNQIKTKKQQICKGGDFLVAEMDAKVGGYGFIPPELDGAIVSSHYYLFELNTAKINPKYLEVLSKLPIIQDQIKATGSTNYAAIRPQNVLDWEIPLPDIQTQEKIVDRYLKTSTGCDYLKSNYLLQFDLLRKIRQQILQDAVRGKLVPQDPSDEPAQKLLERIKTEKEKLVREKKIKKEKPLPEIKPQETPFKIPENWMWCRLGELSSVVRGGSPRPAGDKRYYEGEIPFLKVADLTADDNIYLNSHTYTIKEAGLHKTRYVDSNTLMLTNSGATLGVPKICMFPTTFNDGIAAFLGLGNMDKEFIYYFLKSKTGWYLKEASKGQGQPNLNTDIISMTPFALPPFPEQHRIVTKIKQLLNLCYELELTIKKNQKYTQDLLLVALKEALEPKTN